MYKYNEIEKITSDEKYQIYLYDLLYHEQHIKQYYGKKTRVVPNKKIIPNEDIIYYIKSNRNILLNIDYFFNKIKN